MSKNSDIKMSRESSKSERQTSFVFPVIGRAGLCNELFPWARAELFASQSALPILAPTWSRFRIGPYLRREPEKRRYGRLFHSSVHIHGWARLKNLAAYRKIDESAYATSGHSQNSCVITFSGMRDCFQSLAGSAPFLRERLWEMTVPLHRPALEDQRSFIAMHVRRGDQTRLGIPADQLEARIAQFTPLRWFIAMAHAVRQHPSLANLPILVFTDGSIDEIRDLLAVPGVEKAPPASAIFDLWMLSKAKLLFASGNSTFSMWASYLGNMPTVYAPGKMQPVQSSDRRLEMELSENQLLPELVAEQVLA